MPPEDSKSTAPLLINQLGIAPHFIHTSRITIINWVNYCYSKWTEGNLNVFFNLAVPWLSMEVLFLVEHNVRYCLGGWHVIDNDQFPRFVCSIKHEFRGQSPRDERFNTAYKARDWSTTIFWPIVSLDTMNMLLDLKTPYECLPSPSGTV